MNNEIEWQDIFYSKLNSKLSDFTPSDFRFYNIARLPILARKSFHFSDSCIECKRNLVKLDKIILILPDALRTKKNRGNYEHLRTEVETHLKKIHDVKFAVYYSALYTFLGAIFGGVAGLFLSYIITGKITENIILVLFSFGLITGRIVGVKLDRKKNRENLQI